MLGISLTLILIGLFGYSLILENEIKRLEDKIDLTNLRILNYKDLDSAIDYRIIMNDFNKNCKKFKKSVKRK